MFRASSYFCLGVDLDILLDDQIFDGMFSKDVLHVLWKQEGIRQFCYVRVGKKSLRN